MNGKREDYMICFLHLQSAVDRILNQVLFSLLFLLSCCFSSDSHVLFVLFWFSSPASLLLLPSWFFSPASLFLRLLSIISSRLKTQMFRPGIWVLQRPGLTFESGSPRLKWSGMRFESETPRLNLSLPFSSTLVSPYIPRSPPNILGCPPTF